jgi:PAS domain S-box-containing protein
MPEPLSVLIVEDSENDTRLLVRELERAGYAASWERVETAGSMRSALEGRSWDLIIADYTMPKFSAPAALALLQDMGLDLPFIIVSGSVGEDVAVEAMRAGAHDYLLKGNLKRLFPAIQRELEQAANRKGRRMAEESIQKLLLAVEQTEDAICMTDPGGTITYVNPAFERIYGYSREEAQGKTPRILKSGQHDKAFYERFWKRLLSGESVREQLINKRRDGRLVVVETSVSSVLDSQGERIGFIAVQNDITERKLTEKERERLVAILDATPDFVAIADPQGRALYLNSAGRKLLGIGPDEVLSRLRMADGHPEWARRLILETAIPAVVRDGVWKGEVAFLDREGREVPFSHVILAHQGPDGQVTFFSTISRDLSEQKSLEAQLRQSQKMEAVGQLAGGIAHDFNNLLTAILGYASLLATQTGQGSPLSESIGEIRKAGERAASLTQQLLAFSRKQVLLPEVLDLNGIVTEMNKMLRRLIGEDVELITTCAPSLGRVKADRGQIEQVLMNLVVNARDAMPKGGKLTLETANVALDENYVRNHPAVQPGPYVLLAVSDTGAGMDADTLSHMFEPFFTTKEKGKGTGLGLSTVYGIVKQSGGHIWVYSEPGHGTTFKVYLPRVEEAVPAAPPRSSDSLPTLGTETILLVEDEEAVRRLVRIVLEGKGYTVLEASGWQEALEIAGQQKTIHLVITDVVMPGVGGPELVSRLEAARPGIRVLYMSGYTDGAIVNHGLLGSATAFLQKPFTPDVLLRKVREVLGS